MENIYLQLYNIFVDTQKLAIQSEQDEILDDLLAVLSLPPQKSLSLTDLLVNMRSQWGLQSFSIGLRIGLELASPYEGTDYYTLRKILSEFDQPVA